MSDQRISGYCIHNWTNLSLPCPECADQQPSKTPRTDAEIDYQLENCPEQHQRFERWQKQYRQLETELSTANAEVERLKAIVKHLEVLEAGDGEQFKKLFIESRKHPAYWTEAVDILQGELNISNKQRDALLANSKALAEALDKCFVADNVKIPAIEAHNKLMEQLRPTAAG